MSSKSPRVLFYDIETTHNIVAQFSLREEYTPHENILQERYVVCVSWQWLGEKKIHGVSILDDPKRFAKDTTDDYHVVKTLVDLVNSADVIVAHNGDRFDAKWIQTRALKHKLGPFAPVQSVDTYKVAKASFYFNSNRLDYLGRFLGIGGKMDTPRGLWLKVLKGDKQAIKKMLAYNKVDVKVLRGVFDKLQPYIPNHINRELFGGIGCPRCGSLKIQSRGIHKAISKVYRRFQCQKCTGWFKSTVADKLAKTKYRVL